MIDNRLPKCEIEIIVSREAGRNLCISFEMFCEVLARIAKEKYRKEYSEISPTDALYSLMQIHLYPLYQQLEHDQIIQHFQKVDEQIDEACVKVLNQCISVLRVLYEKYFPCEISSPISHNQLMKRSENAMLIFLHQFDITPVCVNYKSVAKIWQDILVLETFPEILHRIKTKDLGKVFTFKKFVLFLTRCAVVNNTPWQTTLKPVQKVTSLLGRLEHSAGFKEIEKEYMKIHNYRLKLIPLHTQNEILYTISNYEIKEASPNKLKDSMSSDLSLSINFDAYSKIDPHIDNMEHIFRAYCAYGERDYAQRLNLNQFLKLLLDAKIVQNTASVLTIHAERQAGDQLVLYKLARAEAEVIFAQVSGRRRKVSVDPNGFPQVLNKEMEARIDFNEFLKALEMISGRVFINCGLDMALPCIIENYILKINISFTNDSLDALLYELELLRKDDHAEFMHALSSTLSHYARLYQDVSALMSYESFSSFLRDFELFPSVISKSKSVHIYYILSKEYKKSKGITSTNIISTAHTITMISEFDKDYIDFSLFVEGIGLCAMNFNIPNSSIEGKLVYMIERIIYSKGAALASAKIGVPRINLWKNDILVKFISAHNTSKPPGRISFFDMIKEKPKQVNPICR